MTTPAAASPDHALAELGRFVRRSGLRGQTLASTLTPLKGATPADRRSRIRGVRLEMLPQSPHQVASVCVEL